MPAGSEADSGVSCRGAQAPIQGHAQAPIQGQPVAVGQDGGGDEAGDESGGAEAGSAGAVMLRSSWLHHP